MPVYCCYSNAPKGLALKGKDVFTVVDDQDRNWVCIESGDQDPYRTIAPDLGPIMQTLKQLKDQGFDLGSSKMSVHDCPHVPALRSLLSQEP